jgi:hypothetical protein
MNIGTSVASSSTNSFNHVEIPKSLIENPVILNNDIFYPNGSVKPFMIPTTKGLKFVNEDNWRLYVNNGIKNKMEFIENTFISENLLDEETAYKMVEELIGNELGLFKLEHEIKKGYFISPKLYALKDTNGDLVIKAKGIGSKLDFTQFETLIKNESIIKDQERWFKDPANANINIKNIVMHISSMNLKRKQIIENGRLSHTTPLHIDNDKIL